MEYEFTLPNLTGDTGSSAKELIALRRYLFLHIQELNAALQAQEQTILQTQSQQESLSASERQTAYRKLAAQAARDYLPRSRFDACFRAGVLYRDEDGDHWGVELGFTPQDTGEFQAAARFLPGECRLYDETGKEILSFADGEAKLGDLTLTLSGGHITLA